MELLMTSQEKKPWNTPDFEHRFREAMGRKMTSDEREFFGLEPDPSLNGQDNKNGQDNNDSTPSSSAKFAWQALRRISALVGSRE
jgi:hypothetical protein